MRRGDIVLTALAGDYGKPRPAVVVQGDVVTQAGAESVVVCPMTTSTSGARRIRVLVEPSRQNGLRAGSEIMVEKVTAVALHRFREVIGRLDAATMRAVDRALLVVLGIA